ncbi:MAG TPA: hypothetical protein VK540_02820 [Polyangiaceae bacterium]|nr:hypothetical protein [Polyangiaceae bacterium]
MGSATESAAILDVCHRLKLLDDDTHRNGKETLDRVVAMLVKLANVLQDGWERERERERDGFRGGP